MRLEWFEHLTRLPVVLNFMQNGKKNMLRLGCECSEKIEVQKTNDKKKILALVIRKYVNGNRRNRASFLENK